MLERLHKTRMAVGITLGIAGIGGAIGTLIAPGVGTMVGTALGLAVGGTISAALPGDQKKSIEAKEDKKASSKQPKKTPKKSKESPKSERVLTSCLVTSLSGAALGGFIGAFFGGIGAPVGIIAGACIGGGVGIIANQVERLAQALQAPKPSKKSTTPETAASDVAKSKKSTVSPLKWFHRARLSVVMTIGMAGIGGAIGTLIAPGVGTVIGGAVGLAVGGAVSVVLPTMKKTFTYAKQKLFPPKKSTSKSPSETHDKKKIEGRMNTMLVTSLSGAGLGGFIGGIFGGIGAPIGIIVGTALGGAVGLVVNEADRIKQWLQGPGETLEVATVNGADAAEAETTSTTVAPKQSVAQQKQFEDKEDKKVSQWKQDKAKPASWIVPKKGTEEPGLDKDAAPSPEDKPTFKH